MAVRPEKIVAGAVLWDQDGCQYVVVSEYEISVHHGERWNCGHKIINSEGKVSFCETWKIERHWHESELDFLKFSITAIDDSITEAYEEYERIADKARADKQIVLARIAELESAL